MAKPLTTEPRGLVPLQWHMMLQSVPDLFESLGRDPHELIGQPETPWLEFKGAPYQLASLKAPTRERACLELAKDVTALANAGEGVIVIGVLTRRDAESQEDVARALRPVPAGSVNPRTIQDVIWDWAMPKLDVEIRSHVVLGRDRRLWTIYVRRQADRDKPFIVAKEFAGARGANRNLFGMYVRSGSQNSPYPPSQVQKWIHDGWLTAVEERPVPPVSPLPAVEEADAVLADDLRAIGADPRSCSYYLQAAPVGQPRLQRFYVGAEDSLYERLLRISHLRPAGFNLPDGFDPTRTDSGALQVVWPQNDSLSVTLGGLTTAIQGQEHLTWAFQKVAPRGEIWINLMALVEFTLEFWRFYIGHVQTRLSSADSTMWRAGMRGLGNPGEPLIVQLPGGFYRGAHRQSAGVDSFDLLWSTTDGRDPGALAFNALAEVYGRFGLDEALIPYAEGRRISESEILAVRRGSQTA
ncbi:MAG: helix-turn-helix domain-containing protein [Dehalococcoidia bacterium]